jgi:hypothetical protein
MSKNSLHLCSQSALWRKSSSPWHPPRKVKNLLSESSSRRTSWTRYLKKLIIKKPTSLTSTIARLSIMKNSSKSLLAKKRRCTTNMLSLYPVISQLQTLAKLLLTLLAKSERSKSPYHKLNHLLSNLNNLQ